MGAECGRTQEGGRELAGCESRRLGQGGHNFRVRRIRAGGMCPGVLSGLTAAILRGLSTAQAWPVSDSVTLGQLARHGATGMLLVGPRSSGSCRQSPGESSLLLPRGCLCLSTRGKCFSRIPQRAPSPSPRCQHPCPAAGPLPHLLLAYLPRCSRPWPGAESPRCPCARLAAQGPTGSGINAAGANPPTSLGLALLINSCAKPWLVWGSRWLGDAGVPLSP